MFQVCFAFFRRSVMDPVERRPPLTLVRFQDSSTEVARFFVLCFYFLEQYLRPAPHRTVPDLMAAPAGLCSSWPFLLLAAYCCVFFFFERKRRYVSTYSIPLVQVAPLPWRRPNFHVRQHFSSCACLRCLHSPVNRHQFRSVSVQLLYCYRCTLVYFRVEYLELASDRYCNAVTKGYCMSALPPQRCEPASISLSNCSVTALLQMHPRLFQGRVLGISIRLLLQLSKRVARCLTIGIIRL